MKSKKVEGHIPVASVVFSAESLPAFCEELAQREKVFSNIIGRFGYPPFWQRPASFETLVHYILEQQVSLASALAALHKLKERLGDINPTSLLTLNDTDMRACYVSRQKMGYTRHLATCVLDGSLSLEALHLLTEEQISTTLQKIKGIGTWTSDVFMMMSLHRCDRFPIGDIALRNSMKAEFELPVDTDHHTLLTMAEPWRPYRSIAAYLLWHAYLSKKKK